MSDRAVAIVCFAVIVVVGIAVGAPATAYVMSWRYLTNAGYEQEMAPGSTWPVWKKGTP